MKPIKLGVLGLGTVASGVASILSKNSGEISRRIGTDIEIEAVYVRSLDRANPYELPLTTEINDILSNDSIDIVVELMGGINPAKEFILSAIEAKKDVVTANKELIALHGNEIFEAAEKAGVTVAFEASVAGGIPIIKKIREGLTANQIDGVYGIINGTSNYILTEMSQNKSEFADALKDAQELGYAEADPTYDIKGIDAAHKLTILTSIAFGVPLNFESVYTEGIDQLSSEDIETADQLGYVIKHLGIAKNRDGHIEARLHPTLIPKSSPFAHVNGAMNAVLVEGNAVGPLFSSGAGAGSEPTASAVIADIIDIYKSQGCAHKQAPLAFNNDALHHSPFLEPNSYQSQYLIRLKNSEAFDDRELLSLFEKNKIAIEKHLLLNSGREAIFVTEMSSESEVNALLSAIKESNSESERSCLRIERFGA